MVLYEAVPRMILFWFGSITFTRVIIMNTNAAPVSTSSKRPHWRLKRQIWTFQDTPGQAWKIPHCRSPADIALPRQVEDCVYHWKVGERLFSFRIYNSPMLLKSRPTFLPIRQLTVSVSAPLHSNDSGVYHYFKHAMKAYYSTFISNRYAMGLSLER